MHILHIVGCLGRRVLEEVRIETKILQMLGQIRWSPKKEAHTGVSKAKHAMMFGQRGALMSGRVFMNASRESAASKPPMLRRNVRSAKESE
jgi:hypothetical protein